MQGASRRPVRSLFLVPTQGVGTLQRDLQGDPLHKKGNRMTIRTGMAVLASAAIVAGGVLLAPTAHASEGQIVRPATCYDDGAHPYQKTAGDSYYPSERVNKVLKTTTNCGGISIKPTAPVTVAICFVPSSAPAYCGAWKSAPAGGWTVLAASVLDNTSFYFAFASTAYSAGAYAA